MILIGTSGSTRCDWQLVRDGKLFLSFHSRGINPYFHTEDEIRNIVESIEEIQEYIEDIPLVYMYNAGCSSKSLQLVVKRALSSIFTDAHIYVNHDIVAAAFATYQGIPALTAILGTGSNACYFDGDILRQEIPGLDYILGDEGSGSYYGKILLRQYLYHQLPEHLHRAFEEKYKLTEFNILESVYMKPYANVYLASFVKFINEHIQEPHFQDMVRQGMGLFMDTYICCYENYRELKTHFVGSIAHNFSDILQEVAGEKEIEVGSIVERPIQQLVDYLISKHQKR